jgi:multidrug resistance protein, MATE family
VPEPSTPYFPIKSDLTFLQAAANFMRLATPSVAALILRKTVDIVNYAVVGHLEDSGLISGAGLAIITWNILWYSITMGLSGGIDTLSSQAFGNGKNYLAGRYYTRAQVILTFLFIPQALLLYNIQPILEWVGQPKVSAKFAQQYIRIIIIGLYGYWQTEILRRFLGAQGIFNYILKFQLVSSTLHFVWLYIFVYYYGWGIEGVAMCTVVTNLTTFILAYSYIWINPSIVKVDSWHFINADSFKGILEYLKYGIPSLFMIVFELWCFEVMVIIAGIIGINEQAAAVILINFGGLLFMASLGMYFTTSSLIGNNLGAMRTGDARVYVKVSTTAAVVFSAIWTILILGLKKQIASVFTDHEEIKEIIVLSFPVVALSLWGSFIQNISAGVIAAMGYQKYGSMIWIISYWVIGLPMMLFFAFYLDFGVRGIWMGMWVALTWVSTAFLWIIYTADMEELSKGIVKRLQKEKKQLQSYN